MWFTKLKGRGIFTFFITFFLEDQTNFLVSCTSELLLNVVSKKASLIIQRDSINSCKDTVLLYEKIHFRGMASLQTCRPRPTNFWFDHSRLVINYALLGWVKRLKGSKCWWGQCVLVIRAIFRICENESQPGLQLVEKLATPLHLNGKLSTVRLKLSPVYFQSSSLAREGACSRYTSSSLPWFLSPHRARTNVFPFRLSRVD